MFYVSSMNQPIRSAFAPIFSLVISMLGNGFFNTFVSMRLAIEGYSNFVIGWVNSAYYLGLMVGAFYIERLIRRIGHIRSFAIFASINAGIVMMQALFVEPISWAVFRFIVGVTCGGIFIVIESWLLLLSSVETKGKILSLYMLGLYAAQASGQFMLNFMDISSIYPFCFTVIFSTFSVIPVCIMKAGSPILEETEHLGLFKLLKRAPLGFFGCFLAGMVLSAFYALAPIYAKESGMTIFQISQIMGFTIVGGLALQWPIGYLSDIFDRRRVIFTVSLLLMITSLLLYRGGYTFYLILALSILFGGFSFTLYPLSITRASDVFPHSNITAVTCGLLLVYSIGAVLGPLASSFVMQITKPSGLFLYDAVLALLFILISISRPRRRKPAEPEGFFPMPRTSPMAAQLDPRGEDEEEDSESP